LTAINRPDQVPVLWCPPVRDETHIEAQRQPGYSRLPQVPSSAYREDERDGLRRLVPVSGVPSDFHRQEGVDYVIGCLPAARSSVGLQQGGNPDE
jgi:hypothetical protein